MRTFTCQPDLLALDVPSLLICGDRDRHVPLRNHLATQQAIPRCGLQVYFDIGHVPFVETPDTCAADVERFLATIR
jgi:sigma-B regulation protein RsbQ